MSWSLYVVWVGGARTKQKSVVCAITLPRHIPAEVVEPKPNIKPLFMKSISNKQRSANKVIPPSHMLPLLEKSAGGITGEGS